MMRRALSIWLPQLPLDRLVRQGESRVDGPFAVIAKTHNAWQLQHISAEARRHGLTPGLSVPDARAICPGLMSEPCDPVREAALLRALWRWADVLSPRVSLDAPDGLMLDITGCAHLFGGERAMADEARSRLAGFQISSRIGIADTRGAARALARAGGHEVEIAAPGNTAPALRDLPVAVLDLPQALVHDLRRTGLQSIGQLCAIPSAELARRFGLELTGRLARVLGHEPDPVTPASAEPVYAARMTLPDPVGLRVDMENVLKRLAQSVCTRLVAAQCGARRFGLTVRCVDTGDHLLTIGFARPCHDVAAILQQFARPLDGLKIAFGADWFRLAAEDVQPAYLTQIGFDRTAHAEDGMDKTVSTLGNRLGFDRVRRFAARDSHLPEREFTSIEVMDQPAPAAWPTTPRKRPLRLYRNPERLRLLAPGRPPQRFEWRGQVYETEAASGPERLSPEWWRAGGQELRDYWHVQTRSGLRLWLLTYPARDAAHWYVAGRFP